MSQGLSQTTEINLLLRPATLTASLRLSEAFLDGFKAITAGQSPPASRAMTFKDDVGVHQDRRGVARHEFSNPDLGSYTVRSEQIR